MTRPTPAPGSAFGQLRWWVAPEYLRPTRFGEHRPTLVWAVTPVHGRGARRQQVGGATYHATRNQALAYAHNQARRTYGPRPRKDHR